MSALDFAEWAQRLLEQKPFDEDQSWLSRKHLHEMCHTLQGHDDPLKQQRWVGFVQAGLLLHELVTQEELATVSRAFFNRLPD